jgi:hypothetical protein
MQVLAAFDEQALLGGGDSLVERLIPYFHG